MNMLPVNTCKVQDALQVLPAVINKKNVQP